MSKQFPSIPISELQLRVMSKRYMKSAALCCEGRFDFQNRVYNFCREWGADKAEADYVANKRAQEIFGDEAL